MPELTKKFVTTGEAATFLGINRASVRRRVSAGELQAYQDPTDRRVFLFDVNELARYAKPRLVTRREEVPVSAA